MNVYIKPPRKVIITSKRQITVKDITEVIAEPAVKSKIGDMVLIDLNNRMPKNKADYLISVSDIVKLINKSYPQHSVNNLGEQDTWVEYKTENSKDNSLFKWSKIVFVVLVLFFGSMTAIMAFHTDAQMDKVFENFYYILTGTRTEKPLVLTLSYSIGLGVGIIAFFNHLFGKKITDDPTPIEVEMSVYETEINDTMIDNLATQQHRDKKESGNES